MKRANDLLAFGKYNKRQFGGYDDDGVEVIAPPARTERSLLARANIDTTRAFLEWLKQTNNESPIRIALDQFLESVSPSNLVPQTAASTSSTIAQSAPMLAQSAPSSRRDKVLVDSRRYSDMAGVFVHPQDAIFKHLEISREFSDHVRDTGRIFLVFGGVQAGKPVRGISQTWHAVEFSFKDDLLAVMRRPMDNLYEEEVVTKGRPHKEFFLSPGDDGYWDGTEAEDLTARVEENLPKMINKRRRYYQT